MPSFYLDGWELPRAHSPLGAEAGSSSGCHALKSSHLVIAHTEGLWFRTEFCRAESYCSGKFGGQGGGGNPRSSFCIAKSPMAPMPGRGEGESGTSSHNPQVSFKPRIRTPHTRQEG